MSIPAKNLESLSNNSIEKAMVIAGKTENKTLNLVKILESYANIKNKV